MQVDVQRGKGIAVRIFAESLPEDGGAIAAENENRAEQFALTPGTSPRTYWEVGHARDPPANGSPAQNKPYVRNPNRALYVRAIRRSSRTHAIDAVGA